MDFARQQRDPTRHMIGIGFVVLLHIIVIWALINGLGSKVMEVIKKPMVAKIIEEIKPPPPPPPPPKKIVEPQKVREVQPYVPPPDIPVVQPTVAPVIAAVQNVVPLEPVVIAPPAPPAPPVEVAKPAIRQGASCTGIDIQFPKEAIRDGITSGSVRAIFNVSEKGIITDVAIIQATPPRVFDRAIRSAAIGAKCTPDSTAYRAELTINFTVQ